MSKQLPNKLQRLIKEFLANDEEIKKVKHVEKKASKATYKKKDEEQETEEEDMDDTEPVELPVKPKKKLTRKQIKDNLSKQYMEEVAFGNLKYKDAKGRNRTQTYKSWINETKAPRYDETSECWTIPDRDLYSTHVLAQKTIGSLYKKLTNCTLQEMQQAVKYFLASLNPEQKTSFADLLETKNCAGNIISIMKKCNQN